MEPTPDPQGPKADSLVPDPGTEQPSSPEDMKTDSEQGKNPQSPANPDAEELEKIDDSLNAQPTATVTVTAVPEQTASDDDSSLVTALPWVLVGVLLVAVAALAAMVLGRRGRAAVPMPVPMPAPDPASSPVVPELITLADLITTPAAQTQVVRALRTVGVEPVEAVVGAPFDPDVHEAVATRRADDPSQAGTIAVVHRAGWRSASGVVRPAGVEVWTADAVEGA